MKRLSVGHGNTAVVSPSADEGHNNVENLGPAWLVE